MFVNKMSRLRLLQLIHANNFRYCCLFNLNTASNILSAPYANTCRNVHTINKTYNDGHVLKERSNESIETEEEFLVKIKSDPDAFGHNIHKIAAADEDDLKEEQFLENPAPSRRLSTKQYADIIKGFIEKRKIKEAIDVLEIKMIKEDRVKPENYIYNLLLGACGRVGYTKKAFSLYNQMKKRGLQVTGGTYTALFNACANSPWPADGLARAEHLRNIMIEKQYVPNDTNYNAMIKAFGCCGDMSTAFAICDEMVAKKMCLKDDTLNFLLHACISDKEAGFRHALLVWRKFVDKRIPPTIFSFNLMLRCIRDCGLGDIEVTKDAINRILLSNNSMTDDQIKLICSNEVKLLKDLDSKLVPKTNAVDNIIENRPNLMAKIPHMGDILSLTEVKTAEDRLLLVGGCSNFLENMAKNKVAPNIKSFTQLLGCIPSTLAAENELTQAMKRLNVKADLDFYNMLIKKRSMRFDYENAAEVLELLKKHRLKPDLITYGVLALGCKSKEEANALIQEMTEAHYRLNPEILGAMLHQACYQYNFPYVIEVMDIMLKEEIRPNKKFMDRLSQFKQKCKEYSNDKENKLGRSKSFQKSYQLFKMQYRQWVDQVDPLNESEIHPWQQFRQPSDTDVRHLKNKEVHFKARHTSLYKQKKVEVVNKNKFKKNVTVESR